MKLDLEQTQKMALDRRSVKKATRYLDIWMDVGSLVTFYVFMILQLQSAGEKIFIEFFGTLSKNHVYEILFIFYIRRIILAN